MNLSNIINSLLVILLNSIILFQSYNHHNLFNNAILFIGGELTAAMYIVTLVFIK